MKKFITATLVSLTLVGCANTDIFSGDVYTADQARQVQTVTYGTLLSSRPVKIQAGEEHNIIGTVGGAVLGGLLGNTIGGGRGNTLSTAAGAIAGGVAGSAIEGKVNQTDAVELEIRKDSGETIVVVQKPGKQQFSVGQRLRLVSRGGKMTVSPR
ncbi:MAG: glycine zipper 2TM domain-containing protein [Enterobacteriaceae bacterium]